MNKTAFITGAEGWNVIGGYLLRGRAFSARSPKVCFAQCDLRNGQRIIQLLAKYRPTHIFHLGAQSLPTVSWTDPVGTFESNVMGSLHLLAREYFLDYKIPAVNVRLFNTTGPGKTKDAPSDFVRQLIGIKKGLQPPIIEVGNLKSRRAFLDVNDAVRGFYLAAMKGKRGESYNLCASQTYQIGELLRTAIRLSAVKAEVRPVPRLMRPSDERIIFGSAEKIRKDTGWKPLLSIEQTLKSMLEYWDGIM